MTAVSEQSTRRVLWWARSFGRPLQKEFASNANDASNELPEEFSELLEMADERIGKTRQKDGN